MYMKLTKEQIQERINELAEFTVRPIPQTELTRLGYESKTTDDIDDEESCSGTDYDIYEFRQHVIKDGVNITQSPELSAINYATVECEDCGRMCQNRQVEIRLYPNSNRPHKRTFCRSCQRGKNPWTGEFNLNKSTYMSAWSAWDRENPDPNATKHSDGKWNAYKFKKNK